MTSLAINENNDLFFTNYALSFTTNKADEILQRVKIRLRFFEGEWFLNTAHGVPYFESIIGKKPVNLNIINEIFITETLDVDGVLSIIESNLDFDSVNRKILFSFKAKIENGTIESTVTI